ncbi:MAG: HU family DNA-binding protein [Acutalibacteraceae bacterium]|nr:HU family DNA-binding protein [Clostridia bacterium]MEE3449422.1 HU family DNA-binding protein [Acutalibacteraceae bacterium]
MNKSELISVVADKNDITKKDAEKLVVSVLDTIVDCVAKGEDVKLVGFGTFEQRVRKERIGVDPRTGESITIPESKVPAFKPGKVFKEVVDKK